MFRYLSSGIGKCFQKSASVGSSVSQFEHFPVPLAVNGVRSAHLSSSRSLQRLVVAGLHDLPLGTVAHFSSTRLSIVVAAHLIGPYTVVM